MAETGQRVGDYEVIAPLGAGGMGRVYKVRNVISNREEAMKILLPDFASDPDLAARFMAEIRTLATLDHPGIAQLRTAFQHNNQFVMVMEYVEGATLEKLASQVRIPIGHLLDYAMQVLAALSYAHGRGVTHRDIKPANIMITTHGVVKLMDFGIAKSSADMQLTRPGSTMGSVYYMSPEQVRGGTVDGRSDLYSFGVTLYEMLTGHKPFQADTSYSVLNAHLTEPPKPLTELEPSIPPQLNAIVLRAMAKTPEDRYQTAEEFRSALRGMLDPATAAIPAAAQPVQDAAVEPAPFVPYSAPQPAISGPEAPPPFTPVPMPPAPPAPARPRRGLWIGLGAVTAILALAAVAWVLPRMLSTHASPKPVPVAGEAPAPAPAEIPAATTSSPAQPAPDGAGQAPAVTSGTPPATPSPQPGEQQKKNPRPAYVPPQQTAPAPAPPAATTTPALQPAGPTPGEMREARDRYANLESRADAALAGVDQIRSQQRAQGLDLRVDILAAVNRLHHQLDQARQAMADRDLDTANDYMNRADADTARLEKFLGR